MKKLKKLFVAIVALFAYSCATDATEDLGVQLGGNTTEGKTVITLSLEESRTQLGAWNEELKLYPVSWSEGDKISINGVESSAAQIDAENPTKATFVVDETATAPYCVAYPAAPAGKVLFAKNQVHFADKNSFGDGVATMYGYNANGLGVELKHLTGVLKIGIVGSATLSHAQISTIDRKPIAGAFDLDFATGEVTPSAESVDVIGYSFGENGLTLSDKAQYIYVAVPEGIYDEMYVTLYEKGVSGNIMYVTIKANSNKPLSAGNVREFNSNIDYEPNASGYVVYDYATLCGFAEAVKGAIADAPFTKEVIFADDVVVPAASETNPTPWTSIEGYTGTIHGNGYAIEGLTTPLFGTTSATIKGLHLRGVNIVETEKGVVGAFARVYAGQMSHCSTSGTLQINNTTYNEVFAKDDLHHINIGGLIGRTEGATVSDCVNNINLTITSIAAAESTYAYQTIAGGCIGLANLGTTLSGLTNNGVVSYEAATSPTGSLYISGVVGRAGADTEPISLLSITNCTNNGKVTAVESSVRKALLVLSGILGVSTQATVCDQLHNTAEISDYATTSSNTTTYMAGVAGHYINNSASNFSNSGAIKSYGQKYILYIGGVAGHWDKSSTSTFIHDNFDNSGALEIAGTHRNNVFAGGVFSYPQKSPKKYNCDNSGTITVSGSVGGALKLGGILSTQWGQYTNGVYRCTNSGKIHITSTAVLTDTAHIGGLIGNGNNSTTKRYTNIVECYNAGELLFEGTANKNLYIGGLTGSHSTGGWYDSCYNTGKVTVNGTLPAGNNNVGGLLGCAYGSATQQSQFDNCYNEGAIEVVATSETTGNLFVGGVAGRSTKDSNPHQFTLSGCENRATISVSGDLSVADDTATYIGGMLGYFVDESKTLTITNCSTTTAATISVVPSSSKAVYVGGILGASAGTANLTGNTNNAAINATGTYGGTYNLGGIAGGHIGSKVHTQKSSSNNGAITAEPTTAVAAVVGGLVANCGGTVILGSETETEGCKNNAKLTVKGAHGSSNVFVAGFTAYNSATVTCTNCENTANGIIECTPTQGNRLIASGCYGYLYSKATATSSINMTKCYNKAAVNVTVTDKFTNRTFVGGLVAFNELATGYALLTDCENQGNITIGGTSKTQNVQAAGVYGSNYGSGTVSKLTNCYNKGEVVISTASANNIHLGGMVGCAAGGKAILTNCHNEKKIEFSGTAAADVAIGGIAGYTSGYHKIDRCSNSGEVVFAKTATTNGNCRIAGIFGYQGCSSGAHILKCENRNSVTVIGGVPGSKYTAIGGIFGQVQSCVVEGCTNTANGIISASPEANCQKVIIGGVGGLTTSSDAVSLTNCNNKGSVSTTCPAKDYIKVGGILGWFYTSTTQDLIDDIEAVGEDGASAPTKVSVTSTLSGCVNIGKVRADGKPSSTVIGGIVGTSAVPVSESKVFCALEAKQCVQAGMITGSSRSATVKATNCQIGGSFATEYDEEDFELRPKTISESNFYNYIFGNGEATDWTEVENYDGCTCITVAPVI